MMRLSSSDTLQVLRWLAGEDVSLPPAVSSRPEGAQAWRSTRADVHPVPAHIRTGYHLFAKDEVAHLGELLFRAHTALTPDWLVVTLSNLVVPTDIAEREVAEAIATAVNTCLGALVTDNSAIFAPRSFVSKALHTAVEEARTSALIREGRQ